MLDLVKSIASDILAVPILILTKWYSDRRPEKGMGIPKLGG